MSTVRTALATVAVAALLVGSAACGGGGGAAGATADTDEGLKNNVKSYSLAYLAGDGQTAWDLLSARCQKRITLAQMKEMTATAAVTFGQHEISTYEADVHDTLARVTYTYADAASINQDSEPWVKESGTWKQDDC